MYRLLGVQVTTPCSECYLDKDAVPVMVWHAQIPASRFWYPMSNNDARNRSLLDMQKAYRREHMTIKDAILSHILRNDFTQVNCQNHHHGDTEENRMAAFTIKLKVGSKAQLPRMIELDNGDMGVNYCVKGSMFTIDTGLTQIIDLGNGVRYQLIALTYYDANHYVASVVLNGERYKYNDLGHKTRGSNHPRTTAHSLKCEYDSAATPPAGFHHRSYVFSLDVENLTPTQMESLDFTECEDPMYVTLDMLAASDDEPESDVI
jgi:hypothetical protein